MADQKWLQLLKFIDDNVKPGESLNAPEIHKLLIDSNNGVESFNKKNISAMFSALKDKGFLIKMNKGVRVDGVVVYKRTDKLFEPPQDDQPGEDPAQPQLSNTIRSMMKAKRTPLHEVIKIIDDNFPDGKKFTRDDLAKTEMPGNIPGKILRLLKQGIIEKCERGYFGGYNYRRVIEKPEQEPAPEQGKPEPQDTKQAAPPEKEPTPEDQTPEIDMTILTEKALSDLGIPMMLLGKAVHQHIIDLNLRQRQKDEYIMKLERKVDESRARIREQYQMIERQNRELERLQVLANQPRKEFIGKLGDVARITSLKPNGN